MTLNRMYILVSALLVADVAASQPAESTISHPTTLPTHPPMPFLYLPVPRPRFLLEDNPPPCICCRLCFLKFAFGYRVVKLGEEALHPAKCVYLVRPPLPACLPAFRFLPLKRHPPAAPGAGSLFRPCSQLCRKGCCCRQIVAAGQPPRVERLFCRHVRHSSALLPALLSEWGPKLLIETLCTNRLPLLAASCLNILRLAGLPANTLLFCACRWIIGARALPLSRWASLLGATAWWACIPRRAVAAARGCPPCGCSVGIFTPV